MHNNAGHSCITKVKRTVARTVLFREGISFLWGIAKNYIMYWGVTSIIIAYAPFCVNTHD